jgi:hypothetical protein
MNSADLVKGLTIEIKLAKSTENGVVFYWQETEIKRSSDSFVWFNGMGLQRICKTTFLNNPEWYRVK